MIFTEENKTSSVTHGQTMHVRPYVLYDFVGHCTIEPYSLILGPTSSRFLDCPRLMYQILWNTQCAPPHIYTQCGMGESVCMCMMCILVVVCLEMRLREI